MADPTGRGPALTGRPAAVPAGRRELAKAEVLAALCALTACTVTQYQNTSLDAGAAGLRHARHQAMIS